MHGVQEEGMEKKIKLMKLTSLTVFFISMGIAFLFSDLNVFLRWGCAAVFLLTIIAMLLKRDRMDNVDEREMYIEYVAGWVSGILTLVVVNVFIITDVIRLGRFDNRLFGLISVWAVSKAVVAVAMGGGHGKAA
jgi:hypothetical protein